ncbi:MAG: HupE/UreJ family protein [Marinomonas sp.]
MRKSHFLVVAALASITSSAFAHSGHEASMPFMSGFLHPMMGFDHLIAMFAVGLWGARLGGKAIFAAPFAFVGTMIIGFGLAIAGMSIPYIEQGIIASVIFLGLVLAFSARLPLVFSSGLVAVFAFFHGAAHGMELPADAHATGFAMGFAAASIFFHLIGMAFNKAIEPLNQKLVSRMTGSLIALSGVFLAVGA